MESCESLLVQLECLAEAGGLLPVQDSNSNSSSSTDSNSTSGGVVLRQLLIDHVREGGTIDWLVPPLLQGSATDLGGWV